VSLTAKKSGGDFTPVPAGTHLAICYGLIDLGTQTETFEGKPPRQAPKIRVIWELPNERTADGKPMTIGTFYTVSLHEKSTLRKHLEAWRGRPFTDAELEGFQLVNILGKPCVLSVVHKPRKSGDGVSDSVASVSSLMKGMTVPAQENKQLVFDLEHFDRAIYDGLPEFLKKMIAVSPEGAACLGYKPQVGTTTAATEGGTQTSDGGFIPF
jgi:hypothetical protein